jgi:hypothetical protein
MEQYPEKRRYDLVWQYKQSGKPWKEFEAALDKKKQPLLKEQIDKLNEKIAIRLQYITDVLGEEKIVEALKKSE